MELTINEFLSRLLFFFLGIILLSFGISLIIEANVGVTAWDVLHIGLRDTIGFTVGIWSIIVGIIVVTITLFIDRKMVYIGTILNMIFVGIFMDIFLSFLPTIDNVYLQYIILLLGTIASGVGAGLYITANLGSGPRDGLMLALSNRFHWSVRRIKTSMEIIVLIIGFYLGGPVFIGTLIVSILIGPIMQFAINWWEKVLHPVFDRIKGPSIEKQSKPM